MKIKITILIILFFTLTSFAKDQKVNVFKELKSSVDAKDSVACYLKIADYFKNIDKDSSLKYYELANSIAGLNKDYKVQAKILSHIISLKHKLSDIKTDYGSEKEIIKTYGILLSNLDEKSQIPVLLSVASYYLDFNTDSSIYYSNRAILLSEKYNKESSVADAYLNLGYVYLHLDKNTEAINSLQNAVNYYNKANDKKGTADSYESMSKVFIFFNNYDRALEYEQKALKLYNEIDYHEGYYRALRHIGEIYEAKGEKQKSLNVFNAAVDSALQTKDYYIVSSIYQSLGSFYRETSNYEKALYYYNKGLYLRKKYNEPAFRIVNNLNDIGNVYKGMNNFKKAIEYYLRAYKICSQLKNLKIISKVQKNVGMTYTNLGKYQNGIYYLKESIRNAGILNDLNQLTESYYELEKTYEKAGNYKEALKYYEKYSQVTDSVNNYSKQNKLMQYRVIYEKEKNANEIEVTKSEEKKSFITATIALSLLTLIVLLVLLNRYKIRINSNKLLSEKNIEISSALEKINNLNENLKSSETTYRYLFEKNPMPMMIWDINTFKILAVNLAAVYKYGYTKEELLKMKIADMRIDPENFYKRFNPSNLSGNIYKITDIKHKKKDGSVIDVEAISHPFMFENKICHHVMLIDITERKLIEQAVMESEERYRSLFEGAPDGVLLIDYRLGIVKDANPAATSIFKKQWSEIIGTPYLEMFSPNNSENVKKFFDEIENDLDASTLETEIAIADASKLPVEISGILIRSKNYSVYQVIVRDISARKKSERDLIESERRLLRVQKIAHVGNWELNLATNEIWGSKEAFEIYGIEYNEKGSLPYELIKKISIKEERKRLDEEMLGLLKEQKNYDLEFRINKRNTGEERVIKSSAELIKDENGNAVKVLGVLRDITEIKNYQEELIKAKEIAERSDRLKSDFLAQMSHEIRSPVNIILSFASLLKEDLNSSLTEDIALAFNAIDSSGRRLIRTIDLILNTADIQSGKYEPKPEETDLGKDILENLVTEFASAANAKGLIISFNNKIGKKFIFLDRYTITQIFANLIDNAIKYTRKGEINIIYQEEEGQLKVSIADTGVGIAKGYIPRLFDPFSQEGHGYSRRFEGTGLGLSLVKKYCEINNSHIQVESEKGKGTTFTVSINVEQEVFT